MARGMHKTKPLEARRKVYDDHGSSPRAGSNPSNSNGTGHHMTRPGSNKK
jgi:hypothetical protein